MANKRDFLIVEKLTEKSIKDNHQIQGEKPNQMSNAFSLLALSLILDVDKDKAKEAMTDSCFQQFNGGSPGIDSGIDAICFDQEDGCKTVHLFNFKYNMDLSKATHNFASGEINKIFAYVDHIRNGEVGTIDNFLPALKVKTQEIFNIIQNEENYKIVVHLCSNQFLGLETSEQIRFETFFSDKPYFAFEYNFLDDLVFRHFTKNKARVSAKCKVSKDALFKVIKETNVESAVIKISALSMLKMISSDKIIRNKVDFSDYALLEKIEIDEKVFDDNVRLFLTPQGKINKKIEETAITEPDKFYLYNNGLTILCKRCKIGDGSNPTLSLSEFQIVNGSQTMHTLGRVCKTGSDKLKDIFLLCRIYAIDDNQELHSRIAEYTNSQNLVSPRDIKALHHTQIQLEKEFALINILYERKKNQHKGKVKRRAGIIRLDNEKVAQVLVSFYNEDPATARNNTSSLFTDKYDDIFSDDICAEKIMVAMKLFWQVEDLKKALSKELTAKTPLEERHIKYSNYYMLYAIKKIIDKYFDSDYCKALDFSLDEVPFVSAYKLANFAYMLFTLKESSDNPNFDMSSFFKGNKPKTEFDSLICSYSQNTTFVQVLDDIISKIKVIKDSIGETVALDFVADKIDSLAISRDDENKFSFNKKGIPIGAMIEFRENLDFKAEVADEKSVFFEGIAWTLSGLTKEIKTRLGTQTASQAYRGAEYFNYNGVRLLDVPDINTDK